MTIVEITYRYEGNAGLARERPADAEDAQRRLDDGNRAFADLFVSTDEPGGRAWHKQPAITAGPVIGRKIYHKKGSKFHVWPHEKLVSRRVRPADFMSALERDPDDIKVVVQFSQA